MIVRLLILLFFFTVAGCGTSPISPTTTVENGIVENPRFSFSVPPKHWEVRSFSDPILVTLHLGGGGWRNSYIFVEKTETSPDDIETYAKKYAKKIEGVVSDETRKIDGVTAIVITSDKYDVGIPPLSFVVPHENTVYLIRGYPRNGIYVEDDMYLIVDSWKWIASDNANAG